MSNFLLQRSATLDVKGRQCQRVAVRYKPLFLLLTLISSPAFAQRTADNAVTAAGDAFGKAVGNERIGLYSSDDVRGFSPVDAGNARIEGCFSLRLSGLRHA
jgi:hypothetical protein